MSQFSIAAYLTSVATFSIAIFVFFYNKKAVTNRLFCLYSLAISEWSFFTASHALADSQAFSLLLARMMNIGVPLIPIFFFHFCLALLNSRKKYKIRLFIGYSLAVFFVIINFTTPLLIPRVRPKLGYHYFMDGGVLYPCLIIYFAVYVIFGIYFLTKAYVTSSGNVRNQLRYLSWGTILGYVFGVTNFMPVYDITIFPYPFGSYAIALYVAIAAYAIMKYRLMNINIAITKAAIFAIVYTLVLGVPFGLAAWFRSGLIGIFGQNWFWLPMLILLGLATLGPFVFMFLQKKAEGEILKDQRHNHKILMAAGQTVILERDFHKLLKLLVRILTKTLGIKYASIYLGNRDKSKYAFYVTRGGQDSTIVIDSGNSLIKYLQGTRRPLVYEEVKREYDDKKDVFTKEIRDTMHKIHADLLVPTFVADELIGFLALGNKRSGEIYTTEDLNVLLNLANQSALAIENAQFLKEREEMQGKLREAETLTTIRDLLGSFNHEIYNLLTPVSGTLQGITMGDYEKKPERLMPDVKKSVEITFFIKTYLGWVREYVESGDKIAAYQLSELINGGISYSKDKIEKQNIKTQVNVNPKIFVVGHESLPLLFKHLIIHSIYGYGMEQGGAINISARILEDGATVEIIQTDTGDDLTKYIEEGSTMGGKKFAEKGKIGGASYFIAQAVVSKHKGIFELEPTDGKGTKFKIRLPLDFNRTSA